MKLNKKNFLKTELGSTLEDCIKAWDKALDGQRRHPYGTEEYKRAKNTASWCQAQWEIYQMVLRQFYDMEYHFSRTDDYFGLCTDERDWLFKIER